MHQWELLEAFVRVVEAGSFSAAADRLGVSKSLLSKKVALLEKRLGAQLIVRTTRRLSPTDDGYTLFQKCERLISDLDEAEHSILNREVIPRGKLRIVCTDILGEQYIARAAAEMCSSYPDLKIDVHVTMRIVDLIAEGYDLAIRYGALNDSTLKARKICELPHVICASPGYFSTHGRPSSIEDLKHHNCLVATFDPCTVWHFKVADRILDLELQGNWRSNSASSLITAAVAGLGICRLPELYVRSRLNSGELVPIFEEYRSDPLPVWMVYPNARYVPAKVRCFIDYFSAYIKPFTDDVQPTCNAPAEPAHLKPISAKPQPVFHTQRMMQQAPTRTRFSPR